MQVIFTDDKIFTLAAEALDPNNTPEYRHNAGISLAAIIQSYQNYLTVPSSSFDESSFDEVECVARAINDARYGEDYPAELRNTLDGEDHQSRAYAFRLARTALSAIDDVEREREILREAQARRVMPMIGPLLDAWDGLPNDMRSDIKEIHPSLSEWLGHIMSAMEEETNEATSVDALSRAPQKEDRSRIDGMTNMERALRGLMIVAEVLPFPADMNAGTAIALMKRIDYARNVLTDSNCGAWLRPFR